MQVHPWQQPELPIATLNFGEVHIWRVSLLTSIARLAQAKMIISPDELQRGQRLYKLELRSRFWLAHAWKRYILAQYLPQTPSELKFFQGEHGKPYLQLPENETLQFNMSHSADMALFAVTRGAEIGVDIECFNSRIEAIQLAKRFFAAEEYAELTRLPAVQLASGFYRIWTLKEAVIKALGKGLSYNLSAFVVTLAADFDHCLHQLAEEHGANWCVFAFRVDKDYTGAIAVNEPVGTCYCWDALSMTEPFLIN